MPVQRDTLIRRIRWRWVAVVALAICSFFLGSVGFRQYYSELGEAKTNLDIAYLTLQLFTLESGAVERGAVNAPLEWARFLAPLSAAYAIVAAIIGQFSDQIRRWLLGFRGGHVIVCGLGRKGERLVEDLREGGDRVVVIESDEHNPNLRRCRELGCVVITGRADDESSLRRAHIGKASLVIAVAGSDGANTELAVRGHELIKGREDHLRCIVHLSDPDLQLLFLKHDIYGSQEDPIDLEFFNTYAVGARIMLAQSRIFDPFELNPENPPHLLIVGLGKLGEALFRRAVKDWLLEMGDQAQPLKITIVDIDATRLEQRLRRRFPDWTQHSNLRCVNADIRALQTGEVGDLSDLQSVDAAFVCLDDDANAVYGGLSLQSRLPDATPIVVRVPEESGLALLLTGHSDSKGPIEGVNVVGLMDIACTLEFLLNGRREVLAQAIHQAYVHDHLRQRLSPDKNAALNVWHELAHEFKESNRRQADNLLNNLEQIKCRIVFSPQLRPTPFEFTADEVEQLAETEHECWRTEREDAGWRYDETKDDTLKTNPALLNWGQLSDVQKEENRKAVRRISAVLAKADLEIRREVKVAPTSPAS